MFYSMLHLQRGSVNGFSLTSMVYLFAFGIISLYVLLYINRFLQTRPLGIWHLQGYVNTVPAKVLVFPLMHVSVSVKYHSLGFNWNLTL